MIKKTKRYGYIPDSLDPRDIQYKATRLAPIQTTNNRTKFKMPGIFDQGNLGSCTGNGIAAVLYFLLINGYFQTATKTVFTAFSRLFIYYLERVAENTVKSDAGAMIRDGIKAVARYGAPSEKTWPYAIKKFTAKPSKAAYKEAIQFEVLQYARLDNSSLQQLVSCLVSGFPFVFGFTVFESFEGDDVAKTGIMPLPDIEKEQVLGGHCVWCVDYDAALKGFWCVNSWGSDWGANGLFFMPQEYMTNPKYCDDFWTIQMIK